MEVKKQTIIDSDTWAKMNVEVFDDYSVNISMEDGMPNIDGYKERVVAEFEPCDLINMCKTIVEACQKRIESRENDGTL